MKLKLKTLKRICLDLMYRCLERPRPTRSFTEYFNLLKKYGFNPGTVIDVGVADGTPEIYKSFPDAYYILVEPLDEFDDAIANILKRIHGENIKCVLGSSEQSLEILKSNDLYGSSVMHRISDTGNNPRLKTVQMHTLDKIMEGGEYKKPYLLKTDCQGGDFDVIKGAANTLKSCEVIIMEVSFFKFWGDHHPEALEIINYMDTAGFVIHDLLDGLFRPYDNALGQIDISFVKKDGIFRSSHQW